MTIAETVDTLLSDKTCKALLKQNAPLLRDGHGGKLMENVRKEYSLKKADGDARDILNENTVGGRMETLRKQAKELSEQLGSGYPEVRAQALRSSRQVLSEYAYLSDEYTKGNQDKDVSWKIAQTTAKKGEKKFPLIAKLTETTADADKMMQAVSGNEPKRFADFLASHVNKLKLEGKLSDKELGGKLPASRPLNQMQRENDLDESAEELL